MSNGVASCSIKVIALLCLSQCESGGITFSESSFEFLRPAIGHIFVFMFAEGVIFMALTILIEV